MKTKILIALGAIFLIVIFLVYANPNSSLFTGALSNLAKLQKPAQPYTNQPAIQLANQPAYQIKSNFFTGDAKIQDILSGKSYDMDSMKYAIGAPGMTLNKNDYGYKIMSALKMLGYNTSQGIYEGGGKPHILVINQFQKRNGLKVSNFVDAAFIEHLDGQLGLKEKEESKYKNFFPLSNIIQRDNIADVSADHIAKIYSLIHAVLPPKLALTTADSYKFCFTFQCGIGFFDLQRNIFKDVKLDAVTVGAFLMNDTEEITDYTHEFGHYLDGLLQPADPLHLKQGIIDTSGFYNISFNNDGKLHLITLENWQANCFQKKNNDPYEFITDYAASQSTDVQCKAGWNGYHEDFAESFASYILQGKYFRAAAQKNAKIKEKYDWLKTNVFEGIEYDTDLMRLSSSGCNDMPAVANQTPGYLKCQEDYMWDGEIRKL